MPGYTIVRMRAASTQLLLYNALSSFLQGLAERLLSQCFLCAWRGEFRNLDASQS